MIKLAKSEINSLILNYFKQESFIYTAFVFKNESKDDLKNIRHDISLEKILTYGLQYMYGVEHFKDGKVKVCNNTFSLDRLHLCDVVVKKKRKIKDTKEDIFDKTNSSSEENKNYFEDFKMKNKKIDFVEKQTNSLCKKEKNINKLSDCINVNILQDNELLEMQKIEQEKIKKIEYQPVLLEKKSSIEIRLDVKSLAPCKPCNIATIYDEYLYLYDKQSSSLYTFKFGSFIGIKNIIFDKMLFVDDILVMYDSNKIVFYNTFNLKSKSVLNNCLKIFYDGVKFICLNLDGTISYYSRDGIKTGSNIFIFYDIASGCFIENILFIWNNTGKVCMVNTKSQDIHYFSYIGKSVLSHSISEGVLYLCHVNVIGSYDSTKKCECKIFNNEMTGICAIKNNLFAFKDNIISVYKNEEIENVYKVEENIRQILQFNDYILIVFNSSLGFYSQNLEFIYSYSFSDDIEDLSIFNKEICILLVNQSPLLLCLL